MALASIAAGLSIASSLAGMVGGISANKEAKKAIKEQAANTFATRMEEIRRVSRDQRQVLGENRARIGASNLQFTGSPMQALQGLQAEFARDIAWRRNAASKERESILAGAPGTAANVATISSGISSIGNTLLTYKGP